MLSLLLPVFTTAPAQAAEASTAPASESEPEAFEKPAATEEAAAPATPTSEAPAAPAAGTCAPLALASFGDPGAAVGKASLEPGGTACFVLTVDRPGRHYAAVDASGVSVWFYEGTTPLECALPRVCDLPSGGTYTLRIDNPESYPTRDVSAAVTPLSDTTGCLPETGVSWDQELGTGTVASRLDLICHPFPGRSGDRITVDLRMAVTGKQASSWIADETGAPACDRPADKGDGCVLTGDGPYRVLGRFSDVDDAFPASYTLKVRRLSDPAGCATISVTPYGSGPESPLASECRTFIATVTGPYDVYRFDAATSERTRLQVYDADGRTVCTPFASCALTGGSTYTVLTTGQTLVLDRSATQNCEVPPLGTMVGTLGQLGETDCLALPLPAGSRVAALVPIGAYWPHATFEVVDGAGARVTCSRFSCELTGPAPHRLLVSAAPDSKAFTGTYRLALQRTDADNDCPVLPAGDFTASPPSVQVTGSADAYFHCYSIPAADHSVREIVQLKGASSKALAQVAVVDRSGREVCATTYLQETWASCGLTPGAAHTVLVLGRAAEWTGDLSRRDVTATAKGCTPTPAAAVGGPSTGGPLSAPGELVCRQVTTADAGDVLLLRVRDTLGNAWADVYGPGGERNTCTDGPACTITGVAHQVIVHVPWFRKSSGSYRMDAVRIATPAGPAPECTQVQNVVFGYGPVTGTLDEAHATSCATLPTSNLDRFDVATVDTAGGPAGPVPMLYDAGHDNRCTGSGTHYSCSLYEGGIQRPSPSTLVLGLPGTASKTTYDTTLKCLSYTCGLVPVKVGSVSPITTPAGSVATVTVKGTSLTLKDRISLSEGPAPLTATTVSVSPDATTLTATVDVRRAPVGTWSAALSTRLGVKWRGTFSVTPSAEVNTYKAIAPTRVMSTMAGLGVLQGKVGKGETVTLQVAGRPGLPATGVSAVVMNVTAVAPTAAGYVSVFPAGTTRPTTSNLNFKAGQTIPNLVVVPVSADGKVSFYNHSGAVDLLADVSGYYFGDGAGATYKALGPIRVMNTLAGQGVPKAKVGPGKTVTLQVTGQSGIPAGGVTAVAMNVTAVAPTATGYVSVFPAGTARPATSNLNFTAGTTIPNMVIVPVSADGKVSFYNHSGSVDLLADVAGYFTTDSTGSSFKPMAPTRLMNTIAGLGVPQGKVGPGKTVTLQIAGNSGIPATGVTAVVMNVTAVAPTATGYVSVFPDGAPRPATSNLNFTAGTTIPNLVVVPVVNGKVSFYNHAGSVDLLADVAGYYAS
ncbi:hypothetical protein [Streptomyces sp. NPDC126499]|uniref:hypothetical protein n=1 Tax=Streptomyces sp. NPDC126499 TaxID=3155314 RepID=UPI00332F008A